MSIYSVTHNNKINEEPIIKAILNDNCNYPQSIIQKGAETPAKKK
jgi:hypothetical protein